MKKGTLVNCWWEYKLVQPLWEIVWRFLKKFKIEKLRIEKFKIWSSNSISGQLSQGNENIDSNTYVCTPRFTVASFTVASTWKQPECPSIDKWIKTMWYVCMYIYFSHKKKNEILLFATTHMDLDLKDYITLRERSQKEKNKHCMRWLICGI